MRTLDLVSSMQPGERRLAARRCGLRASGPASFSALVANRDTARRIIRRAIETGADTLVHLLLEHAGTPIAAQEGLAYEAELLRGFPFQVTGDSWFVPEDLAAAAAPVSRRERFFATSLIAQLDRDDVSRLLAEFGASQRGNETVRTLRAASLARNADFDDEHRAPAKQISTLNSISRREILQFGYVPGTRGTLFELITTDAEMVVTTREIAERVGEKFRVAAEEGRQPTSHRARTSLSLPPHVAISGVVGFATPRALEEALRITHIRQRVLRRLGDRYALVSDRTELSVFVQELKDAGFELAESTVFERAPHARS